MLVCYVDEAGDTAPNPAARSSIQPVFVLAAVIFPQIRMHDVTLGFLQLKTRYFPEAKPTKSRHFLDSVMSEIKGADLRKNIRVGKRRLLRLTVGFLDRILELVERNHGRILGRVHIKGLAHPINERALYTYSVQDICSGYQRLLAVEDTVGIVLADARTKRQNSQVTHSIFTRKFSLAGDPYDRILEMPSYGHSENHVGLQLADLLCSALLFPMAAYAYCSDHLTNLHVHPAYEILSERYGDRLKRLQFRYQSRNGDHGGITVCDELGRRSGQRLWIKRPAT